MADADGCDDDYEADEEDGGRASKFPFKVRVRRVLVEEIDFIPLNRREKRRRPDFRSNGAQSPGHWSPPSPSSVAVPPPANDVASQQNERGTTGELTAISGRLVDVVPSVAGSDTLPKLTSLVMSEDAFHNLLRTSSSGAGSEELLHLSRTAQPHKSRRLAIAWQPDQVSSPTTEMPIIRQELGVNRLMDRVDDVSLLQTITMQALDDPRSHKVDGDDNEVPSAADCLVPQAETIATSYTLNADGLQASEVESPRVADRDDDPWMPAPLFDISEELVTTSEREWPFEAALPQVQSEIDGVLAVDCPSPADPHAPPLEAEQEQVVPRELDLNSTPIISFFGYDLEDLYVAERDKEDEKQSVKIEPIFSADDFKEEESCARSAEGDDPPECNSLSSETGVWRHSLRLGLSRKQSVQPLHKRRDD